MTTIIIKKVALRRLRDLADYVERRQRAKPAKGYVQREVLHDCGAPGCLIGHGRVVLGEARMTELARYVGTTPSQEGYVSAWWDLLSCRGCNDARTDWRKAVAYVRAWCNEHEAVQS